ncbi:MAG: hypothetical protein ACR2OH_14105 [Microthrixaceae bacterium]
MQNQTDHGTEDPAPEPGRQGRRRTGGLLAATVIGALMIGGAFSTMQASAQDPGDSAGDSTADTPSGTDDRQVIGDDEFDLYDQKFEECLAEKGIDIEALFELEDSDASDEEVDKAWEAADPALMECESVFDGVVHQDDLAFEACLAEQGVDLEQIEAAEEKAIESGATDEELDRVWEALESKFEACELTVFGDDFEDCDVIHEDDLPDDGVEDRES